MSSERCQIIDLEAIRAIGTTMTQTIGAVATQAIDRETGIAYLNTCAEHVPYAALFEENEKLSTAIEEFDNRSKSIDEALTAELARLDSLASTFAARIPSQLDTAKALVDQKKQLALSRATTQKAEISESCTQLAEKHKQLEVTLDAVSTPWPVPPYSDEILEMATQRRRDLLAAQEATKVKPKLITGIIPSSRKQLKHEAEKRAFGPHTDLAASIPALSEKLLRPVSEHVHVYDRIETASAVLNRAVAKPQIERTDTEDFLAKAVHVLCRRFLADPEELSFLEVYEAEDVIELARRLRMFSRKNRPDFHDLEGQILDKAASFIPQRGKDIPQDIQGAKERMEKDASGRTGMTWHSLTKHANRACDTMRARFFAGGSKNTHLKNYVIEVLDRSGTKPDISWIYQFVADDFAFDILARRRTEAQSSTQERFNQNCDIIDAWLNEAQDLLTKMPSAFRLRRQPPKGRRNYRQHAKTAVYENTTAYTSIMNTVKDLKIRRDGQADGKIWRHKPVQFDPQGALSHQLRLGHMIDALKEELAKYDAPTDGYTEEITPFE